MTKPGFELASVRNTKLWGWSWCRWTALRGLRSLVGVIKTATREQGGERAGAVLCGCRQGCGAHPCWCTREQANGQCEYLMSDDGCREIAVYSAILSIGPQQRAQDPGRGLPVQAEAPPMSMSGPALRHVCGHPLSSFMSLELC